MFSYRYFAVTTPLEYNEAQVRKRLPVIFILIWICAALVILPSITFANTTEGKCHNSIYDSYLRGTLFFFFWFIFISALPTTTLLFLYIRMAIVMRRNGLKSIAKSQTSETKSDPSMLRREKRMRRVQYNIIQTCMIVCAFYVLTYAYSFIIDAFILFGVIKGFLGNFYSVGVVAVSINSSINPFIYTIRLDCELWR